MKLRTFHLFLILVFCISVYLYDLATRPSLFFLICSIPGLFSLVALVYTHRPLTLRGRIEKLRGAGLYPPADRASQEDVLNLLRHGESEAAGLLYAEIHGQSRQEASRAVKHLGSTIELAPAAAMNYLKRVFCLMGLMLLLQNPATHDLTENPARFWIGISIWTVGTLSIGSVFLCTKWFVKTNTSPTT